jgi:hypothetical protein
MKYFVLTAEVVYNTYVVEATSEDEAEEMFYDGFAQLYHQDHECEKLHSIYTEKA